MIKREGMWSRDMRDTRVHDFSPGTWLWAQLYFVKLDGSVEGTSSYVPLKVQSSGTDTLAGV